MSKIFLARNIIWKMNFPLFSFLYWTKYFPPHPSANIAIIPQQSIASQEQYKESWKNKNIWREEEKFRFFLQRQQQRKIVRLCRSFFIFIIIGQFGRIVLCFDIRKLSFRFLFICFCSTASSCSSHQIKMKKTTNNKAEVYLTYINDILPCINLMLLKHEPESACDEKNVICFSLTHLMIMIEKNCYRKR